MLRRLTTSVIAAAALVGVAVAPANALVFGDYAGEGDDRQAVVRINLLAEGGVAECTGTAIAEQWVLTAQHCIEGLDREGGIAGTVTTKEGAMGNPDNTFKVNAAVSARDTDKSFGDVALLHVTEPMGVAPAEINYGELAPGAQADAYGWSTLGQGLLGQLPRTTVAVQQVEEHPLYPESTAYVTTSVRPAQLQQGDSGGPIFANGGVAGVLSVGIGDLFNPVLISGTYMHAKMAGLEDWVNGLIETRPTDPARDIPTPGAGSALPELPAIPQLPVIPAPADIIDIVGAGTP